MKTRLFLSLLSALALQSLAFSADNFTATGIGVVVGREPSPAPPVFTGTFPYTADPAIARLDNGNIIISHSIAGPGDDTNPTTKVYRSTDNGTTWQQTATLTNLRRASLIVQGNTLSLVGSANITGTDGHAIVRQSIDSGSTWTDTPATTSGTGYIRKVGTGTSKTPAILNNRIYLCTGTGGLLSAPSTANLLATSSWTYKSLSHNVTIGSSDRQTWPADIETNATSTLTESQVLASPAHGIIIMPKIQLNVPSNPSNVAHSAYNPHSALFRTPNENTAPSFNPGADFVPLPGTEKKFGAIYDTTSQKFYALTGTVLPAFEKTRDPTSLQIKAELIRNTASLYSSTDLIHWELEKIILHTNNVARYGWHYFTFITDNNDLLIAPRASWQTPADVYPPPRAHDSNLITFNRYENFRSALPVHKLTIENGTITRNEITHVDAAPLGNFALGTQPTNPVSIAQLPDNTILVQQADTQILQYDSQGNYLGISTAAFPAGNSTLDIQQTKTPQRTWTQPGGGVWFDARNWHYFNIPDTNLETLTLGSAITGNSTITLDRPAPLNAITFRSANSYTLNSITRTTKSGASLTTGAILLEKNPSTNSPPSLTVALGNHTLNSNLIINAPANITLAANTTLAINGILSTTQPITLNIDLANQSPATPPLSIQNLTATASLTIRLTGLSPANQESATLLKFTTNTLPAASITVTDSSGNKLYHTVANGTISLASPPPPNLAINPSTKQSLTVAAGTRSFAVTNTGSGNMNWTANISDSTWARISSGASGINNGTITVSYDANPMDAPARNITLTVTATGVAGSPKTIAIEQTANIHRLSALSTKGLKLTVPKTLVVPKGTVLAKGTKPTYIWRDGNGNILNKTDKLGNPVSATSYTVKTNGSISLELWYYTASNPSAKVVLYEFFGTIKLFDPLKFPKLDSFTATPLGVQVLDTKGNPALNTVVEGEKLRLTVRLETGTGPLRYTWYKNNLLTPVKTTNNTHDLTDTYETPATPAKPDGYFVVVETLERIVNTAKPLSTLKSKTIKPKVILKPTVTITTLPAKLTVLPGKTLSIAAKATGTAKLNYEWRDPSNQIIRDAKGLPLNKASISIKNVNSSHAGTYTVFVTNPAGPLYTRNTTATVIIPTPAALQSSSLTFTGSSTVHLLATVADGLTLYSPQQTPTTPPTLAPANAPDTLLLTDALTGKTQTLALNELQSLHYEQTGTSSALLTFIFPDHPAAEQTLNLNFETPTHGDYLLTTDPSNNGTSSTATGIFTLPNNTPE